LIFTDFCTLVENNTNTCTLSIVCYKVYRKFCIVYYVTQNNELPVFDVSQHWQFPFLESYVQGFAHGKSTGRIGVGFTSAVGSLVGSLVGSITEGIVGETISSSGRPTGVLVGGTGVLVGGTGVLVGGAGVRVGGRGVCVGAGVFVGGAGVRVGTGVFVGGTGVLVGGTTGAIVGRSAIGAFVGTADGDGEGWAVGFPGCTGSLVLAGWGVGVRPTVGVGAGARSSSVLLGNVVSTAGRFVGVGATGVTTATG
jgi:hypothetical protein